MEISIRLAAVADLVPPCETLADVGTDHAYLPIELLRRGVISRGYACDVKRGPLERAARNIRAAGLEERLTTVFSDGLKSLPEPVDTLVLAGMGGPLIGRILFSDEGNSPDVLRAAKTLVLEPQSEIGELRRLLWDRGFHAEKERMVRDRGKYYVIMAVRPGAEEEDTAGRERFGLLLSREKDPVFYEYLKREREKHTALLDALPESGEAARLRREELSESLQGLEDELAKW